MTSSSSSASVVRRAEDEHPQGCPAPSAPKSPKLASSFSAQQHAEDASSASVSATSSHTRDGVVYRSVGVSARSSVPSEEDVEMEVLPEKEQVDHFKALPRDCVVKILESVLELQMSEARKAQVNDDIRRTGWPSGGPKDKDNTIGSNLAKARYHALIPLKSVCRLWYHIISPWYWSTIDFRHCGTHSYGAQHHLQPLLSMVSNVQLPAEPVEEIGQAPVEAGSITETASTEGGSTAEAAAEPVVAAAELTPPQPRPPYGHYVQSYTVGNCDSCTTYFIGMLSLLPNLRQITLASAKLLKNSQLTSIVTHTVGPALRSLDHVYLGVNEDLSTRIEQIISLLNHAPNIERLGVAGEGFNLSEAYAKRLSFVLKLNSCLKHRQTDTLGVGLRHLYLGPGCSIPISFLRGLTDCAPRLASLHIKTGVKILGDSSPLGQQPFDLHAFAASWGAQLTALTLVGADGFSTRGYLDDVLKLCPNLKSLHLRSDHITFSFFKNFQDLIFKPDPDQLPASSPSSSAGGQKLRHTLEVLAIAVRLPTPDFIAVKGTISSITIFPSAFLQFANACLRIEARTRLSWPTEMGGQRDVLERAALLCRSEKEKKASGSKAQTRGKGEMTIVVGAKDKKSDGEEDGEDSDGFSA